MRLCVVLAELPPNVPEMLALGAVFESVNRVASEWRRGARYGVGEKVAAVCPGHRGWRSGAEGTVSGLACLAIFWNSGARRRCVERVDEVEKLKATLQRERPFSFAFSEQK